MATRLRVRACVRVFLVCGAPSAGLQRLFGRTTSDDFPTP